MPFQDATWKDRAIEAQRIAVTTAKATQDLMAQNDLAAYCKNIDKALQDVGVFVNFAQTDLVDTNIHLDQYQGNCKLGKALPIDEEFAFALANPWDSDLKRNVQTLYILKWCPSCGKWTLPDMYQTFKIRSQEELGKALQQRNTHDTLCRRGK